MKGDVHGAGDPEISSSRQTDNGQTDSGERLHKRLKNSETWEPSKMWILKGGR